MHLIIAGSINRCKLCVQLRMFCILVSSWNLMMLLSYISCVSARTLQVEQIPGIADWQLLLLASGLGRGLLSLHFMLYAIATVPYALHFKPLCRHSNINGIVWATLFMRASCCPVGTTQYTGSLIKKDARSAMHMPKKTRQGSSSVHGVLPCSFHQYVPCCIQEHWEPSQHTPPACQHRNTISLEQPKACGTRDESLWSQWCWSGRWWGLRGN